MTTTENTMENTKEQHGEDRARVVRVLGMLHEAQAAARAAWRAVSQLREATSPDPALRGADARFVEAVRTVAVEADQKAEALDQALAAWQRGAYDVLRGR